MQLHKLRPSCQHVGGIGAVMHNSAGNMRRVAAAEIRDGDVVRRHVSASANQWHVRLVVLLAADVVVIHRVSSARRSTSGYAPGSVIGKVQNHALQRRLNERRGALR